MPVNLSEMTPEEVIAYVVRVDQEAQGSDRKDLAEALVAQLDARPAEGEATLFFRIFMEVDEEMGQPFKEAFLNLMSEAE